MMLMRLRETCRIGTLTRSAREVHAAFDKEILKAAGGTDKRDRMIYDRQFEASVYEDEIDQIRSNRLVRVAQSLDLPIPLRTEPSDHWYRSSTLGSWSLTNLGITELRKAIRQEKRERREVWLSWTGMVVSVLSLVVAILALLVASHWFEERTVSSTVAPPHTASAPATSNPTPSPAIAPHT
jgi:hypothetical protein